MQTHINQSINRIYSTHIKYLFPLNHNALRNKKYKTAIAENSHRPHIGETEKTKTFRETELPQQVSATKCCVRRFNLTTFDKARTQRSTLTPSGGSRRRSRPYENTPYLRVYPTTQKRRRVFSHCRQRSLVKSQPRLICRRM